MSAFRALKDISNKFESELHHVSKELYSAKMRETFEDKIARKLEDLSLYTAKYNLLRAKPLSLAAQVNERELDEETVLAEYTDAVETRVIEQQLIKSATQAHVVNALITAPDRLDPDLLEKKREILAALSAYRDEEAMLKHKDSILLEKQAQLAAVQEQWYEELGALRDARGEVSGPEMDVNNPLYQRLAATVKKLTSMQWLLSGLGVPRSRGYNWLDDPQRRLRALRLAREPYTVQGFIEGKYTV